MSHDVTASPDGISDDLINNVIRIISHHEQYLKSNANVDEKHTTDNVLNTDGALMSNPSIMEEIENINDDFVLSTLNIGKDTMNATLNVETTQNTGDDTVNYADYERAIDDNVNIDNDFLRSHTNTEDLILYNASVNMQDLTNTPDEDLKYNTSMTPPNAFSTPFFPSKVTRQETENRYFKVNEQTKRKKIRTEPTRRVKKSRRHTTRWRTSKWPARYFLDMAHMIYANSNNRRQYKPNNDHQQKINELTVYMQTHYLSTNYFYKEMKRIEKMRVVVDDLRKMIDYLEQPGREYLKTKALECFKTEVIQKHVTRNFWRNRKPNNLNINVLKDPINDGYVP